MTKTVWVGGVICILCVFTSHAYASERHRDALWAKTVHEGFVYYTWRQCVVADTPAEPTLTLFAFTDWIGGVLEEKVVIGRNQNGTPIRSPSFSVFENINDPRTRIEKQTFNGYDIFLLDCASAADTLPENVRKRFLGFYGIQ